MNYYQKLCIKSITGDISDKEKNILDEWLKHSENNNEFLYIENIWHKSRFVGQHDVIDLEADWQNIKSNIQEVEQKKTIQKDTMNHLKISLLKWKYAYVVAIVLVLIASIFISIYTTESDKIITTLQNKRVVVLADHSIIKLNKNSKIVYQNDFDEYERRIKLEGEAYFNVQKSIKPFIIETDNAVVTIMGTELNVKTDYNSTQVFVKKGKVNFASIQNIRKGIELVPGQFSIVESNKLPQLKVQYNIDKILSWTKDEFKYDSAKLSEIAGELMDYYEIDINVDKNLSNEKVTGAFITDNPDSIIAMICLTLSAEYEKTLNGYSIKSISK